ncbi:MAG: phenylalanine--tRNA ligase subunit alpha [Fibrobacteria bacterium]|nr:phenylalanine--tRNA ligase subunit alpha [Fibrobacteria bacterium]
MEHIQKEFEEAVEKVRKSLSSESIQTLKVKYLGKKGKISGLMRSMGSISPEERPVFGKAINKLRDLANDSLQNIQDLLQHQEIEKSTSYSSLDPSLPGHRIPTGAIHPLNRVKEDIFSFFTGLGFEIERGREIETDWYNFEALNIPPEHPARDMQDTFYIDDKVVLRTQTSNNQIHVMESRKPPLRIIAPGFVYRADSDASHAPMFQQVEGLVVDKDISFAQLKGTLYIWVRHMFGFDVKLRFRPSFFPFTEPSAEMDVSCSLCKGKGCRVCSQTGWLEIGGCGCVDPNVFQKAGIDAEEYTGFAFGFGIDRITMIKYGIPEIGLLTANDNRFLRQF